MPKAYRVKLTWADDVTITALSSWRFGLAQFWNQIPGYYAEYMKIYKMSRITSVKVNVTVINTTANTPAELYTCVLPYSDYSRTLAQVKLLPGSRHRFISGSGGLDKATLTHSANLNTWLGVDSRSIRDYQQSASEAASTLALLPDTPVLAVYVGGASTEPTLRVFLKVTYDVEFFEPEYPGSVAVSGPVPADRTVVSKDPILSNPRFATVRPEAQQIMSGHTNDSFENMEEDATPSEQLYRKAKRLPPEELMIPDKSRRGKTLSKL